MIPLIHSILAGKRCEDVMCGVCLHVFPSICANSNRFPGPKYGLELVWRVDDTLSENIFIIIKNIIIHNTLLPLLHFHLNGNEAF